MAAFADRPHYQRLTTANIASGEPFGHVGRVAADCFGAGFGVEKDEGGNARASTEAVEGDATNVPKEIAAGDVRADKSPVVWALGAGGQEARKRAEYFSGDGALPR